MSARVTVRRVEEAERHMLDGLAFAYYSEVLPDGPSYFPALLDRYWIEPGRHPYFIEVDGALAGFALVWNHKGGIHELAEFTIQPEFRHKSVGTQAALLIFEALGGEWTLGVTRHFPGAWEFWQTCLQDAEGVFDLAQGPPKTQNQVGSFTFRVAR